MEKTITRKHKLFYGYWIAIAAAVIAAVQSGAGVYAFSLFVKPLQAEMGWSRGEIMLSFSLYYVFNGISSLLVGRLVDRYESRRVMVVGALVAGAAFALLSLMNSIQQYWIIYALLGTGMSGMGYIPSSAVIAKWFKKRRGMAVGIMSVGFGGGGIVLAPLLGGKLIPDSGWRAAYLFLAIIIWAIVIPIALFVMKGRPSAMGLFPDGALSPEPAAAGTPVSSVGITLKMAIKTPAFWMLAVAFFTSNFSEAGVIQNQVPYLQDAGFPVATAAAALGVVGLTSAIAKLIFGWLCDRTSPKKATLIGLLFQVGGIILLMTIGSDSPLSMIWLYSVLWGFGIGSWLPTMAMLISSTFGLASYGAIFGGMAFALSMGVAAGPLTGGYIYDANQNYSMVFLLFLAMYAISIPALMLVRRPKQLQT